MPSERMEPPFVCDVKGCERRADWAYIGEAGDFYLCDPHSLVGLSGLGWTRILGPTDAE